MRGPVRERQSPVSRSLTLRLQHRPGQVNGLAVASPNVQKLRRREPGPHRRRLRCGRRSLSLSVCPSLSLSPQPRILPSPVSSLNSFSANEKLRGGGGGPRCEKPGTGGSGPEIALPARSTRNPTCDRVRKGVDAPVLNTDHHVGSPDFAS